MSDDLGARLETLEAEFRALHVEQSAHHIALVQILGVLARDKTSRCSIDEGFEQALDVAQSLSSSPPPPNVSPDHAVKVLKVIEEIRSTVLGKDPPRRQV